VIEVTNLNDSGPGSLREAVTQTGARTVVFRVGGTIELQNDLYIQGEDKSYLTIAGQTAPGGGILLKNGGIQVVDCHDIVLRYLRIRIGYESGKQFGSIGLLAYGYRSTCHDLIFDHCSVSWILDDNGVYGNVWNVTFQWCIFGESSAKGRDGQYDCSNLNNDQGGCGFLWGPVDEVNHMSLHHNLIIHNSYRSPAGGGKEHEIINNIIYNAGWTATHLGQYGTAYPIIIDFIGNYYKMGPDTRSGIKEIVFEETHDVSQISLYLHDNFGWNYNPVNPLSIIVDNGFVKRSALQSPGPVVPVTAQGHEEAKNLVMNKVGAILPTRDAVDERLINDFINGTSSVPQTRGINPQWPMIAGGTPPADADHDGMPDSWESSHGLDLNNPADNNLDRDGDGYTNIEEYINELAGNPPSGGGNRPPYVSVASDKTSGNPPLTVQFTATASDPDGQVVGYAWEFGDGVTSTLTNPSHTYSTAGSFTAKVTVTDDSGATASAVMNITVTTPGNAYQVLSVNGLMGIDGILDEFSGANTIQFSKNSLQVTVKLLWDNAYLYFGYDVKDTRLNALVGAGGSGSVWSDDAVEIFLDPLLNKGPVKQADDRQYIVNIKKAFSNENDATAIQYEVKTNGTVDNNSDTDQGYTVEVAVPWSTIGITPLQGQHLGANFAVDDRYDAAGNNFQYAAWMGESAGFTVPDNWGEIELAGTTRLRNSQSKIRNLHLEVWPNPVTTGTKIGYFLTEKQTVTMALFSIHGERIRTLIKEIVPAGKHEFNLSVENLRAGIYLLKMIATEGVIIKQVLLLK